MTESKRKKLEQKKREKWLKEEMKLQQLQREGTEYFTKKYYTKETFLKVNSKSVERGYNRNVWEEKLIRGGFIRENEKYPIMIKLPHFHKCGERCEPHIRTLCPLTDGKEVLYPYIDITMEDWDNLPTYSEEDVKDFPWERVNQLKNTKEPNTMKKAS